MTFAKALARRALELPRCQQEESIREELNSLRSRYRDSFGSRLAALREALAYADEVEAQALELLDDMRTLAPAPDWRPLVSTD